MPDKFPPLSVKNLPFQYRTREQSAIEDLTFTLHEGELLLVAGAISVFRRYYER